MHDTDSRWGIYPWFEELGADLIHPDDRSAVRALIPNGKVFEVSGIDMEFMRLRYGNIEFRARPSLFKAVDARIRRIGETVILADGRAGEVLNIHWHHQRGEPMYQLRIEGKTKSKRYWSSDFDSSNGHEK